MMMQSNSGLILAIDAGNTRVKWGLFNASGNMLKNDACLNADLAMTTLPEAGRVVVSNVAGPAIKAQLISLLPKNIPIQWISAQLHACGVSNRYDQAETLGTDRWAALIAAWHLKQAPCVVVNAGTAVTIDALSTDPQSNDRQAEFLGGLILPGLNLMQQSLGLATAQLPNLALAPHSTAQTHVNIFAKNTADAIYAGALHAIVGAIHLMAHELNLQCQQMPCIVISGGNAPMIYQQLIKQNPAIEVTQQAVIVDNLVLQGLVLQNVWLLENFMQSDSQ